MTTRNGSMFYKWSAGGLAILLTGVVMWAADGAKDTVTAYQDSVSEYARRVDTLEDRVNADDLAQAKMTLQLAAIAQALRVPVIMDTVKADAIVKKDTTP